MVANSGTYRIKMTFTITREQLYDLVWSEPIRNLSKQFGIPNIAFARHCRNLSVPLPWRGYWDKLHAGKRIIKAELPERDLTTINTVSMSGTLPVELRLRLKGELGESTEENEDIKVLAQRLRKRLGRVSVPRNFSAVHPTIAILLKKDEKRREKYLQSPYPWNKPYFYTPFERRRLQFINGVFLTFEKIGGRVRSLGFARELYIRIGNANISFDIRRMGQESKKQLRPASSEKLHLIILHHSKPPPGLIMQWEDQNKLSLEKQFAEIIIGMAVAGEHLYRQSVQEGFAWQRKHQKDEEIAEHKRKEEKERGEPKQLVTIEKVKVDGLLNDVGAWQKANIIRGYVEAVREAMKSQFTKDIEAWSHWALAEADKLDPIISGHSPPQYEDAI
jgi:hypothetical protein